MGLRMDRISHFKTDKKERNKEIREDTVASGKTWTERGIVKGNRNVN